MKLILCLTLLSNTLSDKFEASLYGKLQNLSNTDRISVIVLMKQEYDFSKFREDDYDGKREYIKRLAEESQRPVVEWLNSIGEAENLIQFFVINGFSVRLSKSALMELAQREDVKYIEEDVYRRLIPEEDVAYTIATYPSGSAEIPWDRQIMNADKVWNDLGYRGEGIVIGIMDSGVDVDHPVLKETWRGIAGWHDAVNGKPYPYDDNMHGTACASIIAGKYNLGIAPDAKWIAVKILDANGEASGADMLEGFNWIAGLPDSLKPRVVSNSWGTDDWDDITLFAACSTWKALGILPVFAAGNNPDAPTYQSTPGTYPMALSVGATDPNDEITYYSARGGAPNLPRWNNTYNWYALDWNRHKPDVVAPADPVLTAYPGGYFISDFAGTSAATPHVAGEAALILSKNPYLSLSQLYLAIRNNTKLIEHDIYNYPNDTTGWGRIDAYKAVLNTPLPTDPSIIVKGYIVDDRNGNVDAHLQPGERTTLIISFENRGGPTSSVSATLAFDTIPGFPHYVTYNQRTANLGPMYSGEVKDGSFDITLSSSALYDKYLYFTIKITAGSRTMYRFFHVPIVAYSYPAITDTLIYDNNIPYYNTSTDPYYVQYNYFATRFETASPCSLKAITLYFDGTATNETLFVWKHNATYDAPDAEIYAYRLIDVTTRDAWTTVTLTNPIYISKPGYFWVGIRKSSQEAVPYEDYDEALSVHVSTNDRMDPSSWWGAEYWYDFCWRPIIKAEECTSPVIVEVSSHRIDDSFYGNNDGYIDPGERFGLKVSVNNIGITADSVVGCLSPIGATADSVTIIKDTAFFGTIHHGEGDNDLDPFVIEFTKLSGLSGFNPQFLLVLNYKYMYREEWEEKEDTVSFEIPGPFATEPNAWYWYPAGTGGVYLLSSYPNGTYYWATPAVFGYGATDSIEIDSISIYAHNDANNARNLTLYLWDHNNSTGLPDGAPIYTSTAVSIPRHQSGWYSFKPNMKVPGIFWYGQNSDITQGSGLKPLFWGSPFIGLFTLANSSDNNWTNIYGSLELPLAADIKIKHNHPALSYYTPDNWDSPVVPSNSNSTTSPPILKGDTTVYISGWVALNRSNVNAVVPMGRSVRNIMFLDNYELAQVSIPGPDTISPWNYIYYSGYVDTIPAGRHTLYYAIDWDNVVPSNILNDYLRYWGEQYVFSPIGYLNYNTPTWSGYAPEMTGPGAGYRFNFTAFRTKPTLNQWVAAAVKNSLYGISGDSVDLDLRIYEDAPTSPREGFENPVALSLLGPDKIDFIATWGGNEDDLYPGVYSFGETRDSFQIIVTRSVNGYLVAGGTGTADVHLPNANFAYMENIVFPASTKQTIAVDVQSGNADIAIYLFSKGSKPGNFRNPIEYVAYADNNGAGVGEQISYSSATIDTLGLLIVRKSGSEDYTIRFNNITILPVEENQSNSINKMLYNVPSILKPGAGIEVISPTVLPLTIKLFDIQGRQVAVLVDGLVERGQKIYKIPETVRSGVYFVEVKTGSQHNIHRMIVIR